MGPDVMSVLRPPDSKPSAWTFVDDDASLTAHVRDAPDYPTVRLGGCERGRASDPRHRPLSPRIDWRDWASGTRDGTAERFGDAPADRQIRSPDAPCACRASRALVGRTVTGMGMIASKRHPGSTCTAHGPSRPGHCTTAALYVAAAGRHATALLTTDTRIERSGAPITCEIITVAPARKGDPTHRTRSAASRPRQSSTSSGASPPPGIGPRTRTRRSPPSPA